ncbi:MAG: class I SAM-dependent methyltransferase [Solirubrobacteraceae bacterium]
MPPVELRELVGITDAEAFDRTGGDPLFPDLDSRNYRCVVDFGCGCGRIARQLARQPERPQRYVGVDLHRGMIKWCDENLAPRLPGFTFHHHDVYNPSFNPDPALPRTAPIPIEAGQATLAIAWSVFTHLAQSQVEWYLQEIRRILADDGVAVTTWFLFDKSGFPMMQDFQNALYINEDDITNAVIFDMNWVLGVIRSHGLVVRAATPPEVRGFQWVLRLAPARPGEESIELPRDEAPIGRMPPPLGGPNISAIGS